MTTPFASTLPTPASYTSLGRDAARQAVFARLFDDVAQNAYAARMGSFVIGSDRLPWWVDEAFCAANIPRQWAYTYYPELTRYAYGGNPVLITTTHHSLEVRPADGFGAQWYSDSATDDPPESYAHN